MQEYNEFFETGSISAMKFELKLRQLIAIGEPIARAIRCLEGADITAGDVYLLWLAIMATIRDALLDKRTLDIPEDVGDEIRGIMNFRWDQFFDKQNDPVHMAAFYLDRRMFCAQCYYRRDTDFHCVGFIDSDVFTHSNPLNPTVTVPAQKSSSKAPEVPEGVRSPKMFRTVGAFLAQTGAAEVKHGVNPIFLAYRDRPNSFTSDLRTQFSSYGAQLHPWNTPIAQDQTPRDWWTMFLGNPRTQLLAVSFSVAIIARVFD